MFTLFQIAVELYELLQNVDRHCQQLNYADTICDFLYPFTINTHPSSICMNFHHNIIPGYCDNFYSRFQGQIQDFWKGGAEVNAQWRIQDHDATQPWKRFAWGWGVSNTFFFLQQFFLGSFTLWGRGTICLHDHLCGEKHAKRGGGCMPIPPPPPPGSATIINTNMYIPANQDCSLGDMGEASLFIFHE